MKEFICECGYKAKSKVGLIAHKRFCKKLKEDKEDLKIADKRIKEMENEECVTQTKEEFLKEANRDLNPFYKDMMALFRNPRTMRKMEALVKALHSQLKRSSSSMEMFGATALLVLSYGLGTRDNIISLINEFKDAKDTRKAIREKCLGQA